MCFLVTISIVAGAMLGMFVNSTIARAVTMRMTAAVMVSTVLMASQKFLVQSGCCDGDCCGCNVWLARMRSQQTIQPLLDSVPRKRLCSHKL